MADRAVVVEAGRILEDEIVLVDRLASRFRDDSEITRLRAAPPGPVPISAELGELLAATLSMSAATGGAVDPTVGDAMCRLGYDRDFAALPDDRDALAPPRPAPGWRSVVLDTGRCEVVCPPGVWLDLGATAKAWAADRAARRTHEAIGCAVLVALGGDVAVCAPSEHEGFAVAVGDRCDDGGGRSTESVRVRSGGLATSGTAKRRWRVGGEVLHHIVDPSTGRPAGGRWRTVSVAAASCLQANAAATASIVKGDDAPDWLRSLELPARLVDHAGVVVTTGRWPRDHDEEAPGR